MHILVSLLGVLGMAIFILWRIQQAAYLARDVADVAGNAMDQDQDDILGEWSDTYSGTLGFATTKAAVPST